LKVLGRAVVLAAERCLSAMQREFREGGRRLRRGKTKVAATGDHINMNIVSKTPATRTYPKPIDFQIRLRNKT